MITTRERVEALSRPESNLVCFRSADPPGPASDARHIAVRDHLMDQGTFHLTSSVVSGCRWWRATLMAPATDHTTLARLLDTIERAYPKTM